MINIVILLANLWMPSKSSEMMGAREAMFYNVSGSMLECKEIERIVEFGACLKRSQNEKDVDIIRDNIYEKYEVIGRINIAIFTVEIDHKGIEGKLFSAWSSAYFGDEKAKEYAVKTYESLADIDSRAGVNGFILLMSMCPDQNDCKLRARRLLDKSRKLGSLHAEYVYAIYRIDGIGYEKDIDAGLDIIIDLSEKGYWPAIEFVNKFK